MRNASQPYFTSGELVPRELNKHTRTKLGRGRHDRTSPYRPPWHRANEEELKLVCMPADMFGRVSAICQTLHIAGEDAVELLDVISLAEQSASAWPRLAARAVNDVRHAIALMERDREGVWMTGNHARVEYPCLSSEHLRNIVLMLERNFGYDVVRMLPNLHNEYKRRLHWTP